MTLCPKYRKRSSLSSPTYSTLSYKSLGRVDDLLRPYTQSSPFSADLVYKASFLLCGVSTRSDFDLETLGATPGRVLKHIGRQRHV